MTHFRKHLLATMAVVLVLSLGACGGGSDEEDVRAASEDFVSAFKGENWDEVCSLMTEKSKAQLEQASEALDAKGGCPGVWEKAAKFLPPETEQQLDNFEVDTVKVNGDKATVSTTDASGEPAQLIKEDGEWRVNFAS